MDPRTLRGAPGWVNKAGENLLDQETEEAKTVSREKKSQNFYSLWFLKKILNMLVKNERINITNTNGRVYNNGIIVFLRFYSFCSF